MQLRSGELDAQLAKKLLPAYVIHGDEPLIAMEAADAVRAAARRAGYSERRVLEPGRSFDWSEFSHAADSLSLFAEKKIVELRLPTGKPGQQGGGAIAAYAERASDDVLLLVTMPRGDRATQSAPWFSALARLGAIVDVWPVERPRLPAWIAERLGRQKQRAPREVLEFLAERVEGNLLAAAQEIDKLALLSDGAPIDAARMESLVADAARFDVFRLLDAAMNAQPAQVSRMIAGLRAEGEAVPALLGMVVKELQRATAVARVQARGGNLAAEFRAQQIWESRQAAYRRALARHPAPRWERFVVEAGRVDRMAKGRAAGDAWVALERLLLAVAEAKAQALLAS